MMDIDNVDIDAQLLQQFSAMGTRDKEQLIEELKNVVGADVTFASCRFFLELSNWNLQAAIGAYFDFGFENSPTAGNTNVMRIRPGSNQMESDPTWSSMRPISRLDLRCHPSPSGGSLNSLRPPVLGVPVKLTLRIENCGRATWPAGVQLVCLRESALAGDWLCRQGHNISGDPHKHVEWWCPLGSYDNRWPLPGLGPGDVAEVEIHIVPPEPVQSTGIGMRQMVGELRACELSGVHFGEVIRLQGTMYSDLSFHVQSCVSPLTVSDPGTPPPSQDSHPWPSFPGPIFSTASNTITTSTPPNGLLCGPIPARTSLSTPFLTAGDAGYLAQSAFMHEIRARPQEDCFPLGGGASQAGPTTDSRLEEDDVMMEEL